LKLTDRYVTLRIIKSGTVMGEGVRSAYLRIITSWSE